ncbi:metallo-beta-lactamase superfamily protein [Aspergillus uvarum CBS 121591]|uniref:Metallo-beta-lactamase superfamily protein n=1 Tax=Aspergillus uvarum CBS 121591 TaxID=1448315 RepID=A0A319CLC1_9EURO|nr:metallo-beta-lactamase superfamily protein [Aspergillus uvarum CBS 121591]PYH85360.1 metallo-beta-lactamase superfamily protein [Aspergillus uvarum CBS 121591]
MTAPMQMQQLAAAALPAYTCPPGTQMHILNLGTMNVDEGWLLTGANGSSASNPNPPNKRRDLMLIAGLIEHPEMGLILFETGSAEDVDRQWGPQATDLFPRTHYEPQHHLPAAIRATGHDIRDVKAVIMGHLHLDHAGGLEHFRSTGVPIYVHEEEFKHACWAAATGADGGVYLADYLSLDTLNWQTFSEPQLDLCTGITLYNCPGHTPGLCIMQVNLQKDGTFIWTTDQFHVRENFERNQAQGWLLRDHRAWVASGKFVARLQRLFRARLIFGHDYETADGLMREKGVWE